MRTITRQIRTRPGAGRGLRLRGAVRAGADERADRGGHDGAGAVGADRRDGDPGDQLDHGRSRRRHADDRQRPGAVPPGARATARPEKLTGQLTTPQGEAAVSGNLVVRFAGPGDLLASGHPEGGGSLPENLGLIRSRDHGDTWESVAGLGEGDYHELEVVGDLIIAVNAESPDIQVSRDGGRSWESKTPPAPPIDVVVDPGDPQRWAVSTEQGTFSSSDGGGSWRPRDPTFGARLMWPDAGRALRRRPQRQGARQRGRRHAAGSDRGDVGGLPSEVADRTKRRVARGGGRWEGPPVGRRARVGNRDDLALTLARNRCMRSTNTTWVLLGDPPKVD